MVNQQKKDIALGIVDFLNTCIKDGTVSSDDKESVEVAVDCLTDVFGVDYADKKKVFGDETLLTMYEKFNKLNVSSSSSSSNPAEDKSSSSASASTSSKKELTDEQKKQAEEHKVEGNRQMAQKKFKEAVDCYTEAIGVDGHNAIYYSNRSAAYSSLREGENAASDARKAIEIDPTYSKAYSRLGLALYSLGDAQGALEAYQKGLEAEGDNPSDGMKRGYEAAKKRVEADLGGDERSVETAESNNESGATGSGSGPGAGAGGMPDLSSLLGGGAGGGGMPDLSSLLGGGGGGMPDFSSIMQNPQFRQMAQNIMSNPNFSSMMNNPGVQDMMGNMQNGQMPNFGDLMNNPAIQNIARSMGAGGASGGSDGSSGSSGSNGSGDSSSGGNGQNQNSS